MPTPSAKALAAFEVGARPERLSGGQGTAWRAGDVVLKPLDMSLDALRWQAELLRSGACDGFRVGPPLRSREACGGRLDGVVAAGGRPRAALGRHPRGDRTLPSRAGWRRAAVRPRRAERRLGVADRIAWGEEPPGGFARVPEAAHLLAARTEVTAPAQLIHGDLSGNVLFADGLAPAVIDLAPYRRPAEHASAIVAVDAVLWHGADIELLSAVADAQLLVRALLFRLLATSDPASAAAGYRRAIAFVDRLRSLSAGAS
jgi:prepilin-type processing-associated H-X9-DG protein